MREENKGIVSSNRSYSESPGLEISNNYITSYSFTRASRDQIVPIFGILGSQLYTALDARYLDNLRSNELAFKCKAFLGNVEGTFLIG